mmetsp:Transcript_12406/g.26805  ORF Transcript_12406/g.26805 Transcript_12406/m.26805 type:complete len:331 (+) Transcript_12406:73-1065(+)
MTTVKANWSQLAAGGTVLQAQYNLQGDRLATSSTDGPRSYVQIWETTGATADWSLVSQVEAPCAITNLAWPHPESGLLVAGGSESGSVFIWEAPRPSICSDNSMHEDRNERQWTQTAELQCSPGCSVRHLAFAPRQHGLVLAALSDSGEIHLFEADRVLAPNSWSKQSKFKFHTAGVKDACSCFSWRPFTPGAAPLIVVGNKSSADVWQYSAPFMTWQRVAQLPASDASATIVSVHWAPTLGRPVDLVALGHGTSVDLYSLRGDSSNMDMELLETLPHASPVWKVEFNMLGTCLAVGTDQNLMHLWKPAFAGQWQHMAAVEGTPSAASED